MGHAAVVSEICLVSYAPGLLGASTGAKAVAACSTGSLDARRPTYGKRSHMQPGNSVRKCLQPERSIHIPSGNKLKAGRWPGPHSAHLRGCKTVCTLVYTCVRGGTGPHKTTEKHSKGTCLSSKNAAAMKTTANLSIAGATKGTSVLKSGVLRLRSVAISPQLCQTLLVAALALPSC